MAQNNFNHYSDLAQYTKFVPAGTNWPSTVVDVQKALSLIGSWARTDVGLPSASNVTKGISRIATQSEVDAGTGTDTIVTPATLKSTITRPNASTTVFGLTRFATNTEAAALKATDRSITSSALGYVFSNVTASQTRLGTIKLTTPEQALAGTDETSAVTPKRVVEMIGKFTTTPPAYTPATESNLGLVRLATQAQVSQGTLHDGYAVSPKTFLGTKSSETGYGVTRFATNSEVSAGAAADLAVSPKGLLSMKSTFGRYGVTRLFGGPTTDETCAAAAAYAVFKTRKINDKMLDNDIWLNADNVGAYAKEVADAKFMPSNRSVGNITRIEGGSYIGANDWAGFVSPWEGYSRLGLTISAKFGKNNDDYDNRIFQFDVRVNGENRAAGLILNIENYKEGSRGHYWAFDGYAVGLYNFHDIPPGATVQIVPTNTIRTQHYFVQAIFCTN